MANRSYLYAAAELPDSQPAGNDGLGLRGIAEYAYAIPLVYRILVSADTRLGRSVIWQVPEPIALVGRSSAGIERLERFLARIEHPSISKMRAEALTFLAAHAQRDGWFVLECGEIFEMSGEPVEEKAEELLADMANLDAEIEAALAELAPKKTNLWQRLLVPAQQFTDEPLRELGLGDWSETLYHAPESKD